MALLCIGIRNVGHAVKLKNGWMIMNCRMMKYILLIVLLLEWLEEMYKSSGLDIKKFFNTSGQRYRDLGLKDRINQASDEELLDLLASDGMLIKRPLVKNDQKVTVGFNEEVFEKTWV